MLTPLEPSIDINNELSLSLPIDLTNKKHPCRGEFGHVFVDGIADHYRPHRRPPPKPVAPTTGMCRVLHRTDSHALSLLAANSTALERRYRLCSSLLERPPCLPSPPLAVDSHDKLSSLLVKEENIDLRDDESVISTSTLADDDNIPSSIETENLQLLKTLSSSHELRALSPVLVTNDVSATKNSELLPAPSLPSADSTMDIGDGPDDTTATSVPLNGNELVKKDRPLVEGTDKVCRIPVGRSTILCFPRFNRYRSR